MADKEGDDSMKKGDPGEGPSKLVLSAEDRDAIVDSLLKKLTEKSKTDTPPPGDSGEKAKKCYGSLSIYRPILTAAAALGKPPDGKAPDSMPLISDQTIAQPSLKEAWASILETHFEKHKPSKQVYISAGLPILPKRLVNKMTNWEYINFNELIPQQKRTRSGTQHLTDSNSFLS